MYLAMAIKSNANTHRPEDYPYEHGLAFLLRDNYRYFSRRLQIHLERHGSSLPQWYFLRVLAGQDGLSQKELSDRVGVLAPGTVTALNKLQSKGWIERQPHPSDKRKSNVYLSKEGRRLVRSLLPEAIKSNNVALEILTEEQMEQLRELLILLRAGMQKKSIDGDIS